MLSCVDIHWFDRILCNFIYSQWFDGLKANVLGIGIDIGIAVNDSQQLNGMSSDPIRSDPIPVNPLYHHDLLVYMRIRIECVMKQTYSDLSSR